MLYAQIKDSQVVNIVVADNEEILPLLKEGFDFLIRVDEMSPAIKIGGLYDGNSFSEPPPDEEPG